MSDSVDHLDFFPEDPEAISALYQMRLLDNAEQEDNIQRERKKRITLVMAGLASSMALFGGGMGYFFNREAHTTYHSTISQIPETSVGVIGGLGTGAAAAIGAVILLGRRRPLIPELE